MKVFAALAVPSRWQIVCKLALAQRLSAGEVMTAVGGNQENVGRHLRVLRDAGVLAYEPGADRRVPLYSIPAAFRKQQNELDFGCCIVRIPGANAALGGKD